VLAKVVGFVPFLFLTVALKVLWSHRIVDAYLNGLQIMEHAGKHADECSGGTRRKLSFALAMVGSPRVVLLDEPSTGMDPRSKRFLWDTILASFQVRAADG
jgi:ATP-binding cassette, subfamily A (ABC1), member 5